MWKFCPSTDYDGLGRSQPLLRTLNDHVGRQVWCWDEHAGTAEERAAVEKARAKFTESRHSQKHAADELLRLQYKDRRTTPAVEVDRDALEASTTSPAPAAALDAALRNGLSFYESLQCEDGHWPGDYGGPMFLLPGLLVGLYVTGTLDQVLSPAHKAEMLRYLDNHANEDGGYGLHIEGPSTMFGTVFQYLALRLLGRGPDDATAAAARAWIHAHGGAQWTTSWGKFWLALLGVYAWEGMNPMPPEMWLLPHSAWTGVGWLHPGRFWCHCRMVYLPMSYLYGRRTRGPETALTAALREELYTQSYASIDWNAARNQVAAQDLYYPHPKIQDALWWSLYRLEPLLLGSRLRRRALAECMKHIHYEDENTRYVDIGPVNKVVNMVACWAEDPDSDAVRRHLPRFHDYLWVAEDGMKMQGYNGSQLWDTAFAVQAIAATGMAKGAEACLRRAHDYVERSQVVEEAQAPLEEYYRHISKGAWPFSSRDHGWPISDCSAEGLKAALVLSSLAEQGLDVGPPIAAERLEECVNVLLSYQNPSGGWATYENQRSFGFLEASFIINPSETFGDIIVDYDYVECSSACITALHAFRKRYPEHRSAEIERSMRRGLDYIRSIQRPDGSWYGNWAVSFTYGTWFGLVALATAGETAATSERVRRACEFLRAKQRPDGGWAESYLSSQEKEYHQLPEDKPSHAVNTGWALLALIAARYQEIDPAPLHAAARRLALLQQPSGDWPQQTISGVFNRNCMIQYANYRNIFPIWALGAYRTSVLGAGEA